MFNSHRVARAIKISNVRDGLSKTIAVGEVTRFGMTETGMKQFAASDTWVPRIVAYDGWAESLVRYIRGRSGMTHTSDVVIRPNASRTAPDTPKLENAFNSEHPGGLLVVAGDGGVHFIKDTIDGDVWQALGTIAGRETIDWQ